MADKTNLLDPNNIIKIAFEKTYSFAAEIGSKISQQSFESIRDFLFSGALTSLVGIIICFWLFKHLKTGGISRDEMFKALIWIITFVIVYVIMSSAATFNEFKSWLMIPSNIVAATFSPDSSSDLGQTLNDAFNEPRKLYVGAFEKGDLAMKKMIATGFKWLSPIGAYLALIFVEIYLILLLIIIIGICIFNIASHFMITLFSSFLPICLPLLLMPQTRGHFFVCLKTFLGISMYPALSLIPLTLLVKVQDTMGVTNAQELWDNCFTFPLIGMLFEIISVYLLFKIPTWVSQILGVQDSGGGFGIGATAALLNGVGTLASPALRSAGGAMLGGAKSAAKGVAGGTLRGAGWLANQAGEATGINSMARSVGSAIGGAGQAIKSGASSMKSKIESGARASGNAVTNGVFSAMGKFY